MCIDRIKTPKSLERCKRMQQLERKSKEWTQARRERKRLRVSSFGRRRDSNGTQEISETDHVTMRLGGGERRPRKLCLLINFWFSSLRGSYWRLTEVCLRLLLVDHIIGSIWLTFQVMASSILGLRVTSNLPSTNPPPTSEALTLHEEDRHAHSKYWIWGEMWQAVGDIPVLLLVVHFYPFSFLIPLFSSYFIPI